MPPKRARAAGAAKGKGTKHGKAKKKRPAPLAGFNFKGVLTPHAVPAVVEVLENNAAYPSLRDKAARLGIDKSTAHRLLTRQLAGEPLITYPAPPKQGKSMTCRFLKGAKMLLDKNTENECI
jgi:hypothetical protein